MFPKIRNEEIDELESLLNENCELTVSGGTASVAGKVNILMQTYLSRGYIKNFSMVSDMAYITQVSHTLYNYYFLNLLNVIIFIYFNF